MRLWRGVLAGLWGMSVAAGSAGAQTVPSLRGRVLDADGRPLAGVEILLAGIPRTTSTNAAGAFRFDSLPAGEYQLTARRPGYAAARDLVAVITGQTTEVVLQLLALAQELETINVTGLRGRPLLIGYIHDLDGRPLENVEIVLRGVRRTVSTNAQGTFVFDSVSAKGYQVTAQLPGYVAAHTLVSVEATEPTEVAIRLRQIPAELTDYVVDGKRQKGLYGTVRTPDGQPLEGAEVRIHGGGLSKPSDSAGWFAFPRINPGDYLVEATAAGMIGRPIHVAVPRGGSREIVITLEPQGQGYQEIRGLANTYRDLGTSLSFTKNSTRMDRNELKQFAGRQLCEIAKVRRRIGRDEAVIIVDGLRALNPWSLCAFSADELALVTFGCVKVAGVPVTPMPGYRCMSVWTR